MGLMLDKLKQLELGNSSNAEATSNADFIATGNTQNNENAQTPTSNGVRTVKFPDLDNLPPELGLQILKNLNATDLCLAACVWTSLANDDVLWQNLCRDTWGYASIYKRQQHLCDDDYSNNASQISSSSVQIKSYRSIFMHLDEATLTFNMDWKKGLDYLLREHLVENDAMEIAKFINSTKKLSPEQKEKLFKENRAVLENVIILHNYENQFLPTALRRFFAKIEAPKERNSYLSLLLEKFSKRFCSCNPNLGLSEDAVYILCFSLILLSVDLSSPAVKNKMSKREFIRNTRNALPNINTDFTGHLYDNIYLNGNIASRLDDADLVAVN